MQCLNMKTIKEIYRLVLKHNFTVKIQDDKLMLCGVASNMLWEAQDNMWTPVIICPTY